MATDETSTSHPQHILNFVEAARVNMEQCKEVSGRVEKLREAADRMECHSEHYQLLIKQVACMEEVMQSAVRTVRKYSCMGKGTQRALHFVQTASVKPCFNDLYAALDHVMHDLLAATKAMEVSAQVDLQADAHGIYDRFKKRLSEMETKIAAQLDQATLMQQMTECTTKTLKMRLPEHFVNLDDRVVAVENILRCSDAQVVALIGMGGI
eukprot:evm.model.scf_3242.2 EVM.evm.TU.scf_3242.2   scf_3242:9220-10169(+)